MVTLGINNKISMVEKFGTSEYANSTGAYELDPSLVKDFSRAWRTMHVKSDVFCSASLVGYVIYVHLELKRVPKTDKVRGALACI